jgi:dihydroceramidase
MQLVDELSMIYTTCLMCYATFSYSRSRQFTFLLALGLVSLALFITLYYHYLQDPAFHQRAYAILTVIVMVRSMYVMEFALRPSLKMGEEQHKAVRKRSMTADEKRISKSEDRRDAKILAVMWAMIGCGLSMFLGGFAIWSLDNKYCPTVRRWRRIVGLPWGIALEGHGWW